MNNETTITKTGKKKWIMILLVIVFVSPMALSYFLFHFTPLGQRGGDASHGTLIQPPPQLPDMSLREAGAADEKTFGLYGKWSLVFLVEDQCGETCDQNLYRMRQLRLAQGKHGTRIQRVLLNFGNGPVQLNDRQLQEYAGQLIAHPKNSSELLKQFRLQAGDRPLEANRLYLVDPRGFLMMSYEAETDPGGIIDDMKRLLRYSSVG